MKFGKPKFDKEKFDKKEFDNEKVEKKETAKNDEGKNSDYEDSQKLPLEFAPMLAGADVEETMENVAMFKKLFLKAVEKTLSERLKGSEPKTGGTDEDDGSDPFLRGFGF